MNRRIGMAASIITGTGVAGFSLSMLLGAEVLSFFFSMVIAWGLVPLAGVFAVYTPPDRRAAALSGAAFSVVYTVLVMVVYDAQLTAVRSGTLGAEATTLLDFKQFGLFFSYDLLGYAFMALSTFFTGLSIRPADGCGRWLKGLLMVHGVFFIGCVAMPLLGLFYPGMPGGDLTGTVVLEIWCAYFFPVCILAFRHFKNLPNNVCAGSAG